MEVGRVYAGPSEVGRTVAYFAGLADKLTGLSLPTDKLSSIAFTCLYHRTFITRWRSKP